jgi:signal transduction histidine kinase
VPVPEPETSVDLACLIPAWPEPALLASADGTVRAANEGAHVLLGDLDPAPGAVCATLFGEEAWQALTGPESVVTIPAVDGGIAVRLRASTTPGGELLIALTDATADSRLRDHIDQAERLASIGELLSSVAHELNNPLTSVLGFAEILLAGDDPALPREEISCIRDEAQRCRRIVQNLLDLARSERLQMQPLLLQDVVRKVEEFRTYAARARSIELRTEIDPDLPYVQGDFHRLVQAVLNLTTNAEHAVSERASGARIVLRACRAGSGLAIEVEDNGQGVAPENRTRIFEPFVTSKPRGRGTGLGLSLVHATADAHGGSIRVERAASGGARFVLELPVAEGAEL